MATQRLSQFLALEGQAKAKSHKVTSELYKVVQKPDLFTGYNKTFVPKDEDSDKLEPESKPVIHNATKMLEEVLGTMGEYIDVTLTKDKANAEAIAVLSLGGQNYNLPVTFVVWLEKRLTDIKTFVDNLPVLDETKNWRFDEARNMYVTPVTKTARNKKKKVPLVLYQATDKHPAQVQIVEEDQFQGNWEVEYVSTAVPRVRKETLTKRVEEMQRAVKVAREEANSKKAESVEVAQQLFSWLTAQ